MRTYGLILAGGEGSRLGGVRKADLRIANKTLFDRVADRFPDDVAMMVATGPGTAKPVKRGISLSDGDGPHGGPMAGIAAALRHLDGTAGPDDILLIAAVDAPFLPADYAHRMIGALDADIAAYSAWGDDIFPTNAAFRLSALPSADALPNSPKALLRALGAVAVDWSNRAAQNPFANMNTLADLIALSRRALAEAG